jgi:glyoxylase I family protein
MHFEHVAMNVPDPRAMARWYVEQLGMRIVRQVNEPPYMHFLADATGRVVFELYANTLAAIPNYAEQNPLILHNAFAVEDIDATLERLTAAGASIFSNETQADGGRLAMLRDPWGIPLQLTQRAVPLGDWGLGTME